MNYFSLFEGETPFNKLWLLLDLRVELGLRSTKILVVKSSEFLKMFY